MDNTIQNKDEYIEKLLNKADVLGLEHYIIDAEPAGTHIHIVKTITDGKKCVNIIIPSDVENISLSSTDRIPFMQRGDFKLDITYDADVIKAIGGSGLISTEKMFYGTKDFRGNIKEIDISKLDTSKVKSMSSMFESCRNIKLTGIEHLNTSSVEDMSNMFNEYTRIGKQQHNVIDLRNFNTSNVTDMTCMFYQFNGEILGIDKFDTSKVTNMKGMFCMASINGNMTINFDASNVKTARLMFGQAIVHGVLDIRQLKLKASAISTMFETFNEVLIKVYMEQLSLEYIPGKVIGLPYVLISDPNIQRDYDEAAKRLAEAYNKGRLEGR